jgi:hypothetical protein
LETKPIELRETTISGKIVRLQYADHADPAQAVQWVHFQVKADKIEDGWSLPAIQREALQQIAAVIDAEIQRFKSLAARAAALFRQSAGDYLVNNRFVAEAPGAVPIPPALALFATGLGLMGLLGWRRKKQAA